MVHWRGQQRPVIVGCCGQRIGAVFCQPTGQRVPSLKDRLSISYRSSLKHFLNKLLLASFGNVAAAVRSVFSTFELDVLELPVEQNQQVVAWQRALQSSLQSSGSRGGPGTTAKMPPLPGCAHVF